MVIIASRLTGPTISSGLTSGCSNYRVVLIAGCSNYTVVLIAGCSNYRVVLIAGCSNYRVVLIAELNCSDIHLMLENV